MIGMDLTFVAILAVISAFSRLGQAFIVRLNETMLETCDENAVCSVVHDRYWMPDVVENHCKCPKGSSCPTVFSWNENDEFSINVHARTQLKFCLSIVDIPLCQSKDIALSRIKVLYNKELMSSKTILNCRCSTPNYFKLYKSPERYLDDEKNMMEISEDYTCNDIYRCKPKEFCGFARADFSFVFHRCSCPPQHKCGFEITDGTDDKIKEFLYFGRFYRAHCTPDIDYYYY